MTDTDRTPALAELEAAARPYEYIAAITDPHRRADTAEQALLALVPPQTWPQLPLHRVALSVSLGATSG